MDIDTGEMRVQNAFIRNSIYADSWFTERLLAPGQEGHIASERELQGIEQEDSQGIVYRVRSIETTTRNGWPALLLGKVNIPTQIRTGIYQNIALRLQPQGHSLC